ncbi:MAG: hypothetical protein ABI904_23160, partial [Chloroflexota bacterium]
FAADKAVALGGIEPLDSSNKTFAHLTSLLLVKNFMPIHLYAFEGETGTMPARLSWLKSDVKSGIKSPLRTTPVLVLPRSACSALQPAQPLRRWLQSGAQ